ncbi:MAG: DNA repair protein RecN [Clostridiales bacterium]|nr:DNA repair protein RecN [Clostridiales bacterium]
MLTRLEINDFAVISHAVFEPQGGLNVISGETGAGKSLLIDAIGLILGSKASKNLIRTESDCAYVEAVFDIDESQDEELKAYLDGQGIDLSDGQIIISRKVSRDGKSIARINGRTVVLSVLKDVSSYLVNIHGQHDTQRIFDPSSHVVLLDSFGGEKIRELKDSYRKHLSEYKETVLEIRRITGLSDRSEARKDYLLYAMGEIDNASLRPGEEEELNQRRKEIALSREEASVYAELDSLFNGDGTEGFRSSLELIRHKTEKLADKDLHKRIESLFYDTAELSSDIASKVSKISYDPNEEQSIESRLGLIYDLKSKYGSTVEEILGFYDNASKELEEITNGASVLAELKKKRAAAESETLKAAEALTDERKKTALILSDRIRKELSELEIPDARFEVSFRRRPKERFFGAEGIDDISFLFSANPGQELRDLSETASGGEASRIMLAIKAVLSEADKIPTLIFDEIDTGVSGKASLSIAYKLRAISGCHQVLCVTHTSQLAAAAEHNFLISKDIAGDTTSTVITALDADSREQEVSRLLSGTSSEESLTLAKKLIESFV